MWAQSSRNEVDLADAEPSLSGSLRDNGGIGGAHALQDEA
jgi:hypothetical protein